ncbi:MAG TPA: hypothetical protein VGN06_09880 [Gaiellaceae bacterium]|jgi:hypothetical protein
MARIRVLGAALAAALAAGILASAAPAVPIPRPTGDHMITTTHFVVHYYTDPTQADYSTETQAGDVAAYAERAYALETGWGFPPPLDDGDGHIDIYLTDLSGMPGVIGYAEPDGPFPYASPDSGAIVLSTPDEMDAFATGEGLTPQQEEQKTIAHELFHLFQYATWVPAAQSDGWLLEGTAQWAGFSAIGFPAGSVVTSVGPPDIALTCRDDISGFQMCDPDPYVEGGYSRWAFFQMLANEYGTSFIHNVLVNGAAGQTAATALTNAIAAKGSSLSSIFNEYAMRLMDGDFGVPALAAVRPPVQEAIIGGTKTGPLTTVKIPVNHLSARYVTFQRGDGDGSHTCFAATLSINVAMPAGTSAQPYYYWDFAASTPQALSISGNNASITVPWDTCDWGNAVGWLSIPNAGTTVDAADFTVTSSVTVDQNTPATAGNAPTPASIWGTTVPVPTTDVAPSIDVFGPELLRLSASAPTIQLIVDSSGPGSLSASLGSSVLGTGALRAGNNDLRFVVPKGMLGSLRSSAIAANVLTLTPVSPAGTTGQAVTRQIVIAATPKPKPKPAKHKKKK